MTVPRRGRYGRHWNKLLSLNRPMPSSFVKPVSWGHVTRSTRCIFMTVLCHCHCITGSLTILLSLLCFTRNVFANKRTLRSKKLLRRGSWNCGTWHTFPNNQIGFLKSRYCSHNSIKFAFNLRKYVIFKNFFYSCSKRNRIRATRSKNR